MTIKITSEAVIKTQHEIIRIKDIVRFVHKDGRPIQGRLNEINGEMLYIGQNEVVHLGQIEADTLYKVEIF